MTAKPDLQADADEWRGQWINFYQYSGGQSHFGKSIAVSRREADAIRASWFAQAAAEAANGIVLAYHVPAREPFFFQAVFDNHSDTSPVVVKARNCIFSIAVPYVPPEGPQDDNIPF